MFFFINDVISLKTSESDCDCGANAQLKLGCLSVTPSKNRDCFGFTVFPKPASIDLLAPGKAPSMLLLPKNAAFLLTAPASVLSKPPKSGIMLAAPAPIVLSSCPEVTLPAPPNVEAALDTISPDNPAS